MNCKQGDLAIVVRSCAGNEGKIVHCVRLIGTCDPQTGWRFRQGVSWETNVPLRALDVTGEISMVKRCPDSLLRPIRDSDKEDEIIARVGKPEVVA